MFKRIVICVVMVATLGLMMVGFCGNANARENPRLSKESFYRIKEILIIQKIYFASNSIEMSLIGDKEENQKTKELLLVLDDSIRHLEQRRTLLREDCRKILKKMDEFSYPDVKAHNKFFKRFLQKRFPEGILLKMFIPQSVYRLGFFI